MVSPCLHSFTFPPQPFIPLSVRVRAQRSTLDLRLSVSLFAANPHIPGEIAESTGMKFISHMAASAPPNHDLYWQFNPALHRLLSPPFLASSLTPCLTQTSLTSHCLPQPPKLHCTSPHLIRPNEKQLTTPTIITVMAIRELVTWFFATTPSSQPPSSTPAFWPVWGGVGLGYRTWCQGVWTDRLMASQSWWLGCKRLEGESSLVPWRDMFSGLLQQGGQGLVRGSPTNTPIHHLCAWNYKKVMNV